MSDVSSTTAPDQPTPTSTDPTPDPTPTPTDPTPTDPPADPTPTDPPADPTPTPDPEPEPVPLTPLQEVEAQYNFTFGLPDTFDSNSAPVTMALVCSTKDCPNQNRQIELHDDTILPVFCGGCGNVLHCDHDWSTISETTGTLAAPIESTRDLCSICQTETQAVQTALPPINIADLPVAVISALINSPATS